VSGRGRKVDLRTESDVQTERVTNQTWGGSPGESGWSRLSTGQKASVITAGVLILFLGLLTLIGALAGGSGEPAPEPATAESTKPSAWITQAAPDIGTKILGRLVRVAA
jgi:hypothetical protein